jgi:3-deoxy-manno-octulosonate cytidylyltransferase (CMP-KDO synthetase)
VNILGVIPARLSSTRLPRKVLREIGGVPMVVYVFRRAQGCRLLSDLLVATDSDEVVAACHAHHVPAVMTSSAHRSGAWRTSTSISRGTSPS